MNNSSKNPDLPYWNHEKFKLDFMTDDECKAEFKFYKADVYVLKDALQIPETLHDGVEATCILFKCFAYPIRFEDMELWKSCLSTEHDMFSYN